MLLRCALITAVAVTAVPGTSLAAFKTCQDAYNYGWNTGQIFAGQTFKKIDCDVDSLDKAVNALASATTKLVFSTSDTDAEKECLFTGYFTGLLQRTSTEFEKCQDPVNFGCVSASAVANYAAATFVALFKSLDDPGALNASTIDSILTPDSLLLSYKVGLCSVTDRAGCADTARSLISRNLSYAPEADVSAVVGAACVR